MTGVRHKRYEVYHQVNPVGDHEERRDAPLNNGLRPDWGAETEVSDENRKRVGARTGCNKDKPFNPQPAYLCRLDQSGAGDWKQVKLRGNAKDAGGENVWT